MDISDAQEDKIYNELEELLNLSQEGDSFEFIKIIKSYNEHEFKRNFRLNRSTILELIKTYELYNLTESAPVDVELEVYVYIWYLSNNLTLREISNLFKTDKTIVLKALKRVSKFIINRYNGLLGWPTHDQCMKNSVIFEELTKIPNIIGVMDLVHIRIKAPEYDYQNYLNEHRFYSVRAQVIVDAEMKFIDVYCNEPGSLRADCILRNSPIYQNCMQSTNHYFPQNTFILGKSDKYPVKSWLIPPYGENGHLSSSDKKFNHLHYGASKIAKDAVDQLLFRFRKLSYINEYHINLNLLENIIYSAFTLHNMCIVRNDVNSDFMQNSLLKSEVTESSRRQWLVEELLFKNII